MVIDYKHICMESTNTFEVITTKSFVKIGGMNTLSERLNYALEVSGMDQSDLARRIGIKPQAIQAICSGRVKKSGYVVPMARELKVRPEWLGDGKGPMHIDDHHLLPPPHRMRKEPMVESATDIAVTEVPIVGTTQGGPTKEWLEFGYPPGFGEGYLDVPAKDPDAYALRVVGSSMSPRMREGELVLVYPNDEPIPGDEVVVKMKNGEVMVKELVYIRSDDVALDSISEGQNRIIRQLQDIEFMHVVAAICRPGKIKYRPE